MSFLEFFNNELLKLCDINNVVLATNLNHYFNANLTGNRAERILLQNSEEGLNQVSSCDLIEEPGHTHRECVFLNISHFECLILLLVPLNVVLHLSKVSHAMGK